MTTIRPISTRQRERNREYAKVKRIWRQALTALGLWVCKKCGGVPDQSPHHSRGRIKALLCAHQYFVPVCRPCHQWIGDHPNEARKLGLLCNYGDWGKQPHE
jgi:hypothetical protein